MRAPRRRVGPPWRATRRADGSGASGRRGSNTAENAWNPPIAPPRPPEFGATISCRRKASQLERLANDRPLRRRGLVQPAHRRGVRRVLGYRRVVLRLAQDLGDRVGGGV